MNWLNSPNGTLLAAEVATYLPVFSDLQSGDNYYYAYVIDSYNCSSLLDSINLIRPDLETLKADDDVAICRGTEVTIGATGALTYYWLTANDGESEQHVTVQPTETTNYVVLLKDSNGCQVYDTV